MKTQLLRPLSGLLLASALMPGLSAQGTAFTYQGRLTDGTGPATGTYDLRFSIHDAASGGHAVAGPIVHSPVSITDGLFTATLDFGGNAFTGEPRWLEIAVRPHGTAAFTPLASRQPLTPTPYALRAQSAGNATLLNGQSAAAYAPATGSPAYAPSTGSPSYVAKAGDTMTGPLKLPVNGLLAGVNQLVLASGGVGIGTANPGGALEIASSGQHLKLTRSGVSTAFGMAVGAWGADNAVLSLMNWDTGKGLAIDPAGKVGIGTRTPTQELDVAGEVAAYQFIADAGTPEGGSLLLRNSGKTGPAAYEWALFNMSGGYGDSFQLWSYAADDSWWGPRFVIYDTGTTVLAPSGGNVGIGTLAPAQELDVAGEVAAYQFIADGAPPEGGQLTLRNRGKTGNSASEWSMFNMSGGYRDSFQIWSYAADASWGGPRFVIHDTGTTVLAPSGGKVGVGTAAPMTTFEVNGTMRATGLLFTDGGLVIQNRTFDPPNPAVGQIWLRTDL